MAEVFEQVWVLFEATHLTKAITNYNIEFGEAMKQTLMSELAGDFSFSLRAGSGIHLHIRKSEETADGFRGVIENAFWTNGNGEQLKTAPGVMPLFLCLEQEPSSVEDGDLVKQSFVIPDDAAAEFAHRALVTLLRFSIRQDDVHWRKTLEEGVVPPIARAGFRALADQALASGFLKYGLTFVPSTMPTFLRRSSTASDGIGDLTKQSS